MPAPEGPPNLSLCAWPWSEDEWTFALRLARRLLGYPNLVADLGGGNIADEG
jgi:hypothetical protein